MKILMVTSNPLEKNNSAMLSIIALTKGFKEAGHDVTIVSFSNYTNDSSPPHIFNNIKQIRLEPNKVYGKLISSSQSSRLKNIVKRNALKTGRFIFHNFSLYDNYKKAIKDLKEIKLNEYYDLMISFSDPKSSHLLAEKIISDNTDLIGKWIQHWGDPMAIDISRKSRLPLVLVKRSEKKILSKSSGIIYVSPFTYKRQTELFTTLKERMHFIPLAYINEKKYEYKNSSMKNVKIGYFGNFSSKIRDIRPIYEAISNLETLHLTIVGDSDIFISSKNNISIDYERKSPCEIEKFEEGVDLLVVICNKKGTQIPGKLFYYAGTNKPILVIIERTQQELGEYLKSFNRFIVCYNEKAEIFKTLNSLEDKMENVEFRVLEEFSPLNITKKIIKL